MELHRYVFAVVDEPYCVFEYDLDDLNRRFLRSIDATYFEYLAEVHGAALATENRQRAAIALRTAYHHGIETLFTLLGAFIQAPLAVAAWMPRCGTAELRTLVERLQRGATIISPDGPRQFLFETLSAEVHRRAWDNHADRDALLGGFARVWSRFAGDFLDPLHQDEYNSIKHGFRVHAGGFVLRVGIEKTFGVAPPAEDMQTVGASEFGAHFYQLVDREGSRASRRTREFRLDSRSMNWRVERMLHCLPLLAMSVSNVASKLRLLSGEAAADLPVQWPTDLAAFDEPWRYSTGATSSTFTVHIPWSEIEPVTEASLRLELEEGGQHPTG